MDTLQISGYMNEVTWDGRTLRVRGTNKTAQLALVGGTEVTDQDKRVLSTTEQNKKAYTPRVDELVLEKGTFEVANFKDGNMLTNGQLVLTSEGETYKIHFRRKSNKEFRELRDALIS